MGLPDAEFWGDYTRPQDEILERLDRLGFRGLLVDLPRTVRLDEHGTVPLVGWYVRTLDGAEPFRRHMNGLESANEQLSAVHAFFDALETVRPEFTNLFGQAV